MNGAHPTELKPTELTSDEAKARPTYLRAKTLAAKLGVHFLTISRWADEGKVTRFKVSDAMVLYNEAEVYAYVASCGHKPKRAQLSTQKQMVQEAMS